MNIELVNCRLHYFTVNEAAALFRMSRQKFILEIVQKRQLPFTDVSGKMMFAYSDIEEFHSKFRKQYKETFIENLIKVI